jgi:hypothetical protein
LITPDQVISEIQRLTAEASKAPQAIYEAEKVVADKQLAYVPGTPLRLQEW